MGKGALFDIAPLNETVTLRGVTVPVKGLGVGDLVALINRFPEMQVLLGGGAKLDPSSLLTAVPNAVYAAIAYGTMNGGDPEAEERIAALSFGDQLKLFDPIFNATLGEDGARPMLARLNEALIQVGGGPRSRAATSPRQSKS